MRPSTIVFVRSTGIANPMPMLPNRACLSTALIEPCVTAGGAAA